MSFTGDKVTTLPFLHADQPDKPNTSYPSTLAFKQAMDSSTQALQTAHNALIDDLLNSSTGTSASEQLGSAPITGVTGSTVYTQLAYIEGQVQDIIGGSVPPGTITGAMIQDNAITLAKMADNSVSTAEIVDGSVTYTEVDDAGKLSRIGGVIYAYKNIPGFL